MAVWYKTNVDQVRAFVRRHVESSEGRYSFKLRDAFPLYLQWCEAEHVEKSIMVGKGRFSTYLQAAGVPLCTDTKTGEERTGYVRFYGRLIYPDTPYAALKSTEERRREREAAWKERRIQRERELLEKKTREAAVLAEAKAREVHRPLSPYVRRLIR